MRKKHASWVLPSSSFGDPGGFSWCLWKFISLEFPFEHECERNISVYSQNSHASMSSAILFNFFSTTWSTNKRVPHIRIEVQTRNFKQSALPLIRKLPSRSISPSQTPRKTLPRAVEVSVLPWNWVNWAKVRYVKDEKGLTKSLSRFEMWFWRIYFCSWTCCCEE